ncbi:MAG TPA: methyl-accepting chemotaxis protein, partial [Paraburkholderia sp.]
MAEAGVLVVRAGTSGNGFAAVASEVRLLAQRSASAASDIKVLMADSLRKVGEGAALATQAGETMQQVVRRVGEVATLIEQISTASDAQAADIGGFCQNINAMDAGLEGNVEQVKKVA